MRINFSLAEKVPISNIYGYRDPSDNVFIEGFPLQRSLCRNGRFDTPNLIEITDRRAQFVAKSRKKDGGKEGAKLILASICSRKSRLIDLPAGFIDSLTPIDR